VSADASRPVGGAAARTSTTAAPGPGLHVDAVLTRGDFTLEVALAAAPGEVVALLGPNGAGKSTTLRLLAGLLDPDDGAVHLDGAVLADAATGRTVPPERRPVGVVFQDYLLFPHLSARENVAFGPRARGVDRRRARASALTWLDRVGLAAYADVRPGSLSGGQAQRVALARALATSPRLLLLDEPLAALDASTRAEVRADLRHHLAAFDGVTVVVTHDALDAMVLADRLVVLEEGRVVQEGTPADVAHHPRTDYVARLVGLNLHRGTAADGVVTLDGGGARGSAGTAEPGGPGAPDGAGSRVVVAEPAEGDVFVSFAPTAVSLFPERPAGSPRNAWRSTVATVERHGATARVVLDGPVPAAVDVTPAAVAELGLTPGATVWAVLKATETRVYPA
jgi:molybdate transport system ATP-binding protein